MTAIDLGVRATGEGKATFFVRFSAPDVDLRVRCDSCFRLRPLNDFLDDEDPGLPEGVVDFSSTCTLCSYGWTVGEGYDEQPAGPLKQILYGVPARLRGVLQRF